MNQFKITKEQFNRFDFNNFVYMVSGGTVNYQNDFSNLSVSYHTLNWSHHIFEYLLSKNNANVLYSKIDKVEKGFDVNIFNKIKKLRWFDTKVNLILLDYQHHFSEFSLKGSSSLPEEDDSYEQYKREVYRLSSKLFTNIGANEQLERESSPGSKYYRASAFSILVKYKNKHLDLIRFKFLDKSTSYLNQGKLVSILYAVSYLVVLHEHNELPEFDINTLLTNEVDKKIFTEILNKVKNVDEIMIFREPKIGKIFEKYTYKFSSNYYYLYTLHTREGIDISRGGLVEGSLLIRDQEIAGKYLKNTQDTFDEDVCYFNFVEALLDKNIYDDYIPEECYAALMDVINEIFFEAVLLQQQTLYHMIKQRARSAYTKNIKSCHLTNLEVAKLELSKIEKDFKKKGLGRIKKTERDFKAGCIQKWINFLETNGRIDPGSNKVLDFLQEHEGCSKYVTQEFLIAIPWTDWNDYVYFAKNLLKEKIPKDKYKKYHHDLDLFLESIFSNKSFLYTQDKGGRTIFFTSIEKQFDTWGQYEKLMTSKKKKASLDKVVKKGIRKKAVETLKSFFKH